MCTRAGVDLVCERRRLVPIDWYMKDDPGTCDRIFFTGGNSRLGLGRFCYCKSAQILLAGGRTITWSMPPSSSRSTEEERLWYRRSFSMGRTIVLCLSVVVIVIFALLPFCFSIRQTNPDPKAAHIQEASATNNAADRTNSIEEGSSSSRMGSRDVRTLFGDGPPSNHSRPSNEAAINDDDKDDSKMAAAPMQQQDCPLSVASTSAEILLEQK